ncbi:hypothetical protein RHODGE_RHODGE_00365 [Rhodoplanes serenus]|uniref:Uncharacterized protein n=1 Tax=Rhodoplanes serenus TaxID=200615 RepID=A0A447CPI2_9BRAD|nr:hypothetical protein [Rhodoplanes serenus]VCU07061.1 hypothetical protein RHODGE_RHODGE_00365 [Rhodoplanes serenus]
MTEPENHTLHLLREIREAIGSLDTRVQRLDSKVDHNHADLTERLDRQRQAVVGEGVLGRYAAAEVEDRLAQIERRLSALERRG